MDEENSGYEDGEDEYDDIRPIIPEEEKCVGLWTVGRMRKRWGFAVPLYLNTILAAATTFTILAVFISMPVGIYVFFAQSALDVSEQHLNIKGTSPTEFYASALKAEIGAHYEWFDEWCFREGWEGYRDGVWFHINEFFRRFTLGSRAFVGTIASGALVLFSILLPYVYQFVYGALYYKTLFKISSCSADKFEDYSLFFRFSRPFKLDSNDNQGTQVGNLADEFRDYLAEEGFSVQYVSFIPSESEYISIYKKISNTLEYGESILRYIPLLNVILAKLINRTKFKSSSRKNYLDMLMKRKREKEDGQILSSICAVTFQSPNDAVRAFHYFRNQVPWSLLIGPFFRLLHLMPKCRFKDAKVSAQLSSQETSINWGNIHLSKLMRLLRMILVYMVVYVVFFSCFLTGITLLGLIGPMKSSPRGIYAVLYVFGINSGWEWLQWLFNSPVTDGLRVVSIFLASFLSSKFLNVMTKINRNLDKSSERSSLIGIAIVVRILPFLIFNLSLVAFSYTIGKESAKGRAWGTKCFYHMNGRLFFFIVLLPIFVSVPYFPAIVSSFNLLMSLISARGDFKRMNRYSFLRRSKFDFANSYGKIYQYILFGYLFTYVIPMAAFFLAIFFWITWILERINFCLFYNTSNLTGKFPKNRPIFPMLFPLVGLFICVTTMTILSRSISPIIVVIFIMTIPLAVVPPIYHTIFALLEILFGPSLIKRIYLFRRNRKKEKEEIERENLFRAPFYCLSSSGPKASAISSSDVDTNGGGGEIIKTEMEENIIGSRDSDAGFAGSSQSISFISPPPLQQTIELPMPPPPSNERLAPHDSYESEEENELSI